MLLYTCRVTGEGVGRVKSQRSACRYGARDRSSNLKDTVRGSDKVMTSLTITVNCSRVDSSWSSMVHILVCLEIQVLERVTMMSKGHLTVISHGLYTCVQTLLMLQVYADLAVSGSRIPRIPCSCSSRAEELQSPQTYSQPISYVSSFPS